jgi:hypothetical protein
MSAPRLHVFTSAAVNYLPKVRTLCRSIRKHHPEAVIHFALADERPEWLRTEGEPFDDVVELPSLGIPNWRNWSFKHNIVELSTAIKPFVFRQLFTLPDCDRALYFDPDMVLYSRVDDILAELARSNIALTPHQIVPETSYEAIIDNEIGSLKWGIFNLGFIGVRRTDESRRFLDWWSARTYEFCRADVARGLFTDQKWLDFAPVFFDGVAIIRSPRHNVATWNLTTRHMTGDCGSGYLVNREPLGFYHFTGFDSGAHRIMAGKNASGNASVAELIATYVRDTEASRDDPVNRWPWAFGRFSDGTPVEERHRWVYRERPDLQYAFPDPYDNSSGGATFYAWFETEGRVRFPALFSKEAPVPEDARADNPGVSFFAGLRMALLMLAPRAGKSLRQRLMRLIRREGLGGVARRLRGSHSG